MSLFTASVKSLSKARTARYGLSHFLHYPLSYLILRVMKIGIKKIFPGIMLALFVAVCGIIIKKSGDAILPLISRNLSEILITIILGLLIGNLLKFSDKYSPGLKFCTARFLKLGIILMGIRLGLTSAGKIGLLSLCIVTVCIITGIFLTILIARKSGISRKLGTLIAAGTAICGVSAIVAVAPGIKAKEEETAYAVATITLFGTVVTFVYPYITHALLGMDTLQAGLFMGSAIHDTSQVTGAGLIYDQLWRTGTSALSAADVAITTKMVRNIFLVIVVPALTIWALKNDTPDETSRKGFLSYMNLFPLFVLGFLFMVLLRTAGDNLFPGAAWNRYCEIQKDAATYFIVLALAAVGLSTKFSKLKTLGYKPILIGLTSALTVGIISCLLIKFLV